MEKFNLKWNDFQINVTKSFSSLRKEKDFFDVTLVSDDEQHVSAHKVVLSASSEFFKNILRKAQHSSPMIYLSGVSSKDLSAVMDYIYQGEVQLFQEELDNFLETAQKLKIDGLIGSSDAETDSKEQMFVDEKIEAVDCFEDNNIIAANPRTPRVNPVKTLSVNNSNVDAKAAVDQLIEKVEEGWRCKPCGKISKSSDIRRHAEIHIEGLSFECNSCNKTYRSRNILRDHVYKNHKF